MSDESKKNDQALRGVEAAKAAADDNRIAQDRTKLPEKRQAVPAPDAHPSSKGELRAYVESLETWKAERLEATANRPGIFDQPTSMKARTIDPNTGESIVAPLDEVERAAFMAEREEARQAALKAREADRQELEAYARMSPRERAKMAPELRQALERELIRRL